MVGGVGKGRACDTQSALPILSLSLWPALPCEICNEILPAPTANHFSPMPAQYLSQATIL